MALLLIPIAIALVLVMIVLSVIVAGFAVAQTMPWLLILVGVWMLFKSNRRSRQAQWRPVVVPPRPVMAQPRAATRPIQQQPPRPRPVARSKRELPIDVQVKVEQIRRKADVLLGYADRFPPFSQDLHIVRQTTAEYLPRTVQAYLALPGHDDPVIASGKTAIEELREQLLILDSKLDDIAQDLQRQDVDRMLANRRFLEERFQMRDGDSSSDAKNQATDAA